MDKFLEIQNPPGTGSRRNRNITSKEIKSVVTGIINQQELILKVMMKNVIETKKYSVIKASC